ncbi:MAG: hypothetical protein IAF08_08410 [Rhizobacter sp.]|nr:hypothetical protein [Chlorobiales bacterium]
MMKMIRTSMLLALLVATPKPVAAQPARDSIVAIRQYVQPEVKMFLGYLARPVNARYGLSLGFASSEQIGFLINLKFNSTNRNYRVVQKTSPNEPTNIFNLPELDDNRINFTLDFGITQRLVSSIYGYVSLGFTYDTRLINYQNIPNSFFGDANLSVADFENYGLNLGGGVIFFPVPFLFLQLGIDSSVGSANLVGLVIGGGISVPLFISLR